MESEEKIGLKKVIEVSAWTLKAYYNFAPVSLVGFIITRIAIELEPLVYAYFFSLILDSLINLANGGTLQDSFPLLGAILAYQLISSVITYISSYFRNVIRINGKQKWKIFLYEKINSLGLQTLEQPEIENKITRARESLDSSVDFIERFVIFIARIFKLIASAVVLITILPMIIPLLLLITVPKFLISQHFLRKDWRFYKSNTEYSRKAGTDANFLFSSSNLHEIIINSSYSFFDQRYKKFQKHWIDFFTNLWRKSFTVNFLIDIFEQLVIIFGYLITLDKLINKVISIGQVTFYIRSLSIFTSSLAQVSIQFADLFEFSTRIKDAKDLFDMKPGFEDGTKAIESKGAPLIELKNLNFKYPNSESHVIKNLDLTINPGEKIAIVGENGAGKTTLVKLLTRLYRIDEGELLIDKVNINDIKVESLYKKMGVLFQDYNNYGYLTVRENIYLGDISKEIDDEKIKKSAEAANAKEFIEKYKDGYDQILSEKYKGGIRPSTGQWQKLAIARFFYRDSSIVIFDEPTASIDAISEAKIFKEIYNYFKDKTVIIISHRFSTVRYADKIYVLDDGKIKESGTHEELMKVDGKYAESFKTQAEGYN